MALFRGHKTEVSKPPANSAAATMEMGSPLLSGVVEARVQEIGRELLRGARQESAGPLSRQFWSGQVIDWAMKDAGFRTQLFRFIDVFPTLHSAQAIHNVFREYLMQPAVALPPGLGAGMAAGGVLQGIFARTVASRIEAMGERFIAGADVDAVLPMLGAMWKRGIAASVDLLGEACVSDAEAAAYQRMYVDLVEKIGRASREWTARSAGAGEMGGSEAGARGNVSVKISALCARIRPADVEGSIAALIEALRPILDAAHKNNVTINFDMEQHALKDLTMRLFKRCCQRFAFGAAIAMQAYLKTGEADAEDLIEWARRTKRAVTVRLIKGAYWDYETLVAEQMAWPTPVWEEKRQTDACFERMARLFVEGMPREPGSGGVTLAVGTHNARSIAAVLALAERAGLPADAVEFQMLYGMAGELLAVLRKQGRRVRQYVPVGPMIPGMAYLVRRLLENTSNQSWVKSGLIEHGEMEALLASPHREEDREPGSGGEGENARRARRNMLSAAVEGLEDGLPFFTEPVRDFSDGKTREAFARAIGSEGARAPVVGANATVADAARATESAARAWPAWRDRPVLERARMLIGAAQAMRLRRDELCGMIIGESGKNWIEADADVCEAIDFCRFYAREAVALCQPRRLGRLAAEIDEHWHVGRGVAAVISPWNFPLSICTGMTAAALVCGNTVVLKPAEQTPGIASVLCRMLWDAGVPREALHFVPGAGETVGAHLVRDPRVALIAFTGSAAVGFDVIEAAGRPGANQATVKHVVCEMGGKNAIIVDETADLDEAVLGVRQSAFSYGGQKCSACSRVIVVRQIHDAFVRRLVESAASLRVGDAMEPGTDVGPLIDSAAAKKVREYISIGRSEGTLELAMEAPAGLEQQVGRPFVGPHIFSGIEAGHRLAQEEVFGPVLAVMKAESFQLALQMATAVNYRLTGGVYSRTPSHIERARGEFLVGNLYVNRGITGALVGRQPFGGFGWSGLGTQAGGREYLLQFMVGRSCTENALRRGFAPEPPTA